MDRHPAKTRHVRRRTGGVVDGGCVKRPSVRIAKSSLNWSNIAFIGRGRTDTRRCDERGSLTRIGLMMPLRPAAPPRPCFVRPAEHLPDEVFESSSAGIVRVALLRADAAKRAGPCRKHLPHGRLRCVERPTVDVREDLDGAQAQLVARRSISRHAASGSFIGTALPRRRTASVLAISAASSSWQSSTAHARLRGNMLRRWLARPDHLPYLRTHPSCESGPRGSSDFVVRCLASVAHVLQVRGLLAAKSFEPARIHRVFSYLGAECGRRRRSWPQSISIPAHPSIPGDRAQGMVV